MSATDKLKKQLNKRAGIKERNVKLQDSFHAELIQRSRTKSTLILLSIAVVSVLAACALWNHMHRQSGAGSVSVSVESKSVSNSVSDDGHNAQYDPVRANRSYLLACVAGCANEDINDWSCRFCSMVEGFEIYYRM